MFLRNCCFCCWLHDYHIKLTATRRTFSASARPCQDKVRHKNTLLMLLPFSHWSAAPMIKGFKWRPTIIASLVTQNSNVPRMTARCLPSSLVWPFKIVLRFIWCKQLLTTWRWCRGRVVFKMLENWALRENQRGTFCFYISRFVIILTISILRSLKF